MSAALAIARLGLQEAVRRRVFLIVAVLTVGYLALYGLGTWQAFDEITNEDPGFRGVEADIVAGATLLGLNMFGTLFLGTILAVFLTLGTVRGDAERGLLQPLLVRPVPRRTLLAARFASAALVCGAYVIVVFLIATVTNDKNSPYVGVIDREGLQTIVELGLGRFFARVKVSPVLQRGQFQGFRVTGLDPAWNGGGVLLDDIVVRLNELPIERPEQAQAAFESLHDASEISVDLMRDGKPKKLRYRVESRVNNE